MVNCGTFPLENKPPQNNNAYYKHMNTSNYYCYFSIPCLLWIVTTDLCDVMSEGCSVIFQYLFMYLQHGTFDIGFEWN